MISFREYLNESYSSELKKWFTNSQLQKIDDVLSKEKPNYTYMQDSGIQHYKINKFRLKFGVKSGYVIFLMKDGTFAIMEFYSIKSYYKLYAENKDYRTDDIIANATDAFVFTSPDVGWIYFS